MQNGQKKAEKSQTRSNGDQVPFCFPTLAWRAEPLDELIPLWRRLVLSPVRAFMKVRASAGRSFGCSSIAHKIASSTRGEISGLMKRGFGRLRRSPAHSWRCQSSSHDRFHDPAAKPTQKTGRHPGHQRPLGRKNSHPVGAASPAMFYDYYGFPEEAYTITYPAPGSPELAQRIASLLQENGMPARVDAKRGFDHGLFIPLKMMYPQADIPAIQLSLLSGLDPVAHLALGKALRRLRDENILVIGSGFSFHNLRAFFSKEFGAPDPANDAFQDWLIEVCTGQVSQLEREELLGSWEKAPHARYCHPREEHLLPLQVCAALAGKPARLIFDDQILGKRSLAFLW
ncbi:MAG: class III extradiol ring-cleavage dioxygenase [Anaerolineaceae bacterium]